MAIHFRGREIDTVLFNGIPYETVKVNGIYIIEPLYRFALSTDGTYYTASPYRKPEGEVEIPATYVNTPVLGLSGFQDQDDITKVTFTGGHSRADDYCFSDCQNLQEVYGISSVGRYAFQNCYNLYKIGATMYHLSEGSFYGCTALSEITIGNGIGAIPFNCFYGCDNLTTVYFLGTEFEWNELLIQDGNEALKNAEIIFHEHTYSEWVTTKNPGCATEGQKEKICSSCGAKVIETISATGHAWGEWSISLEPTCTTNGSQKRYCPQCDTYETRNIPATGHDLGEWYEYWSPTCTEKGELCRDCNNCNYVEVKEIPATGHDLGEWYTTIEPTDTEKGQKRRDCQREGCNYYEVAEIASFAEMFTFELLADGTYAISRKEGVSLTGVIKIPSTYNGGKAVTKIKDNGFKGEANITSFILPDSITTIGSFAFNDCPKLVSLGIPTSVTAIGDLIINNYFESVFSTIYYGGTESDWANITIGGANFALTGATVYYYSEEEPATKDNYWYKVDGYVYEWGIDYSSLVFVPLEDDTYGVAYNGSSSTVIIPHQYCGKPVTQIFGQAFEGCENLSEVKLPDTIVTIGERAFASAGIKDMNSPKEITIPNSVIRLGDECFAQSGFWQIKFNQTGSKLVEIPYGCFRGCSRLGYTKNTYEGGATYEHGCISIPNSVTYIGASAFDNSGIGGVTFGGESQLVRIDDRAFFHCYDLKNISIPEGCLYIGNRVFDSCYKMTEISIPASLVRLGHEVFYACNTDLQITVGEGNATYKYEGGCLIEIREDGTEEVTYGNQNSEIPSTASSIGSGAFSGSFAAPIKIPLSVNVVKSLAFRDCENLIVYVEAPRKPKGWSDDWHDGSIGVVWGYTESGDSSSHSYGGWTTTAFPTCMKPGTMQRTCSICGEVDIVMIPPLRHDYETVEVAPTCTTKGYKTYTCKRCGHSYTDEIPALGHDYKAVKSIAQNCVTDGYIRYTCSICGDTYDKIVPADGVHSNSFIRNVEPTCTEKGYALYICDDCGAETRKDYVEALGHVWGKWNDVHPAECEIEGTRESTCTRCGEKEIRAIPASGHDWDIDVEVVEPTCTEGGYTIHTCNACGTTRKDNFTGALGHSYVDGICTRCNNDKRGVIYYGVSTIPQSYNSSFILGLDHKTASDSHLESISVTPLEDEYIYYCSPTAFGDCAFAYNGFIGGFSLIIEGLALTNAGGKTEAYNIYKSNQANLGANGAITITIKEMG